MKSILDFARARTGVGVLRLEEVRPREILEGAGMRDLLRKMKPNHINDLVALVALYRPGPMDAIPTYIARKNGKTALIACLLLVHLVGPEAEHARGVRRQFRVLQPAGQVGQFLAPGQAARIFTGAMIPDGADAVAITLLHSYRNPAHERRIGELVRDVAGDTAMVFGEHTIDFRPPFRRLTTGIGNDQDRHEVGASAPPAPKQPRARRRRSVAEHAAGDSPDPASCQDGWR